MTEKFLDFFNPSKVDLPIHIIGCGAIGSTLAIMMARCGMTNIHLWDFDTVMSYNLANQQFLFKHIGLFKTIALMEMLQDINPHITIKRHGKWEDEQLEGHVFLAVDNIELRHALVSKQLYNNNIVTMWDYRMRLTDAQHYGCDWSTSENRKNFLKTMDFTQAEADEQTPVSACNMTLSIMPTVQAVVAHGLANFINFINTGTLQRLVMVNPFI
jgi:hypothetical protein